MVVSGIICDAAEEVQDLLIKAVDTREQIIVLWQQLAQEFSVEGRRRLIFELHKIDPEPFSQWFGK
ncbi:MAG: hypothetical protein AAB642_01185 [Patescibacteria group bacterium]